MLFLLILIDSVETISMAFPNCLPGVSSTTWLLCGDAQDVQGLRVRQDGEARVPQRGDDLEAEGRLPRAGDGRHGRQDPPGVGGRERLEGGTDGGVSPAEGEGRLGEGGRAAGGAV